MMMKTKDLKYLKKIIKKSENVLKIINQSNLGAGLSRNLGIKNAKGEFVAFIDADDTWHKKKLEEQINFMKVNNFQVSHTSYNIIDINRNLISRRKARTFNTVKSLIKSCDIGLSTVIAKRSIFNQELIFQFETKRFRFVSKLLKTIVY